MRIYKEKSESIENIREKDQQRRYIYMIYSEERFHIGGRPVGTQLESCQNAPQYTKFVVHFVYSCSVVVAVEIG